MKVTGAVIVIYGLLILVGGVMGYVKGGSTISLLMGSLFGVALLFCAYFLFKKSLPAHYITLALTFLLDGIFTHRFVKTLHFFPAGLLSLLSLTVLILVALRTERLKREAKSKV